jgi:hypothetical protein
VDVDRINWKLVIKCTWLAAGLSIWLLGLGSCLTEPEGFTAINIVLPFIFVLSFPGSLLFIIFFGPLIDFNPAVDYSCLALGALAVGYFQWFQVIPSMFGKPKIVRLELAGKNNTETIPCESTIKKLKAPRSPRHRLVFFDKRGRTPLERALKR